MKPTDQPSAPTKLDPALDALIAEEIDADGYRKNVGIIVCNDRVQVLWARRVRHDGWQFPQGGIQPNESARAAVFRELQEEIGLGAGDVRWLGVTQRWLRYEVPRVGQFKTHPGGPVRSFRGQKQLWFLFKLIAAESRVRLDVSNSPEFDQWCWVDYWQPLHQIVSFKRAVYQEALTELEPLVLQQQSAAQDE